MNIHKLSYENDIGVV